MDIKAKIDTQNDLLWSPVLTPQISGDPTLPGELTVKESSLHCPLIVVKEPAAVGLAAPFNKLNEVATPVAGFERTNDVKSNLRGGEFVDYLRFSRLRSLKLTLIHILSKFTYVTNV